MTFDEAVKHKKHFEKKEVLKNGKSFRIMVVPSDIEFSRKYYDFYVGDVENIKDEAALHFSVDQNYRVAKIWMDGKQIEFQILPSNL